MNNQIINLRRIYVYFLVFSFLVFSHIFFLFLNILKLCEFLGEFAPKKEQKKMKDISQLLFPSLHNIIKFLIIYFFFCYIIFPFWYCCFIYHPLSTMLNFPEKVFHRRICFLSHKRNFPLHFLLHKNNFHPFKEGIYRPGPFFGDQKKWSKV